MHSNNFESTEHERKPKKQEVMLNSTRKVNMTHRIAKLVEKTSRTLEAVVLMAILLTAPSVKGEGGCRVMNFLGCEKDRALIDHVIKSFSIPAPGIEDCQHLCYLEDNCVSYNLGPVIGMTTSCELNNVDHWSLPHHVIPKTGFQYCPIKNPCSSSPCSPDKIICIPDFAWDNFTCTEAIWSQWTSWTTCHLSDCRRNRTRNCTKPLESRDDICSGLPLETKECQIPEIDITGCESPLGMESRIIRDSQITASSIERNYTSSYGAKNGRLNNQRSWVPRKAVGEYIQVDLERVKMITKIATQGRPSNKKPQWVTKYSVSYSNDSSEWTNYQRDCVKKFPGNSDIDTVFTNYFEVPIIARYIRVIVQKWNDHAAMRLELYGCDP